jgi:hypothetical protein
MSSCAKVGAKIKEYHPKASKYNNLQRKRKIGSITNPKCRSK